MRAAVALRHRPLIRLSTACILGGIAACGGGPEAPSPALTPTGTENETLVVVIENRSNNVLDVRVRLDRGWQRLVGTVGASATAGFTVPWRAGARELQVLVRREGGGSWSSTDPLDVFPSDSIEAIIYQGSSVRPQLFRRGKTGR
jgi:hypothetical protein